MFKKFIKLFLCMVCLCIPCTVYAAGLTVTPTNANGVFEVGESIECVVEYDSSISRVRVNVDNYFASGGIYSDSWSSLMGGTKTINLGNLPTGWYDVIINQGSNAVSTQIVVVPKSSERYTGETPFATDLAANHILKDAALTENYSKAAKKAGFNWIRERYIHWGDSANFAPLMKVEKDEGLDIVALSTEFATGGYSSQEAMFTDDLTNAYDYQKKLALEMKDTVDVWEIWNEMDHNNFLQLPADIYSPFFKASAIAVKDSGADAKVMFGGLCVYPDETDFASIMMKNDVMRYSDIYNIHRHLPVASTATQKFDSEFIKEHTEVMQESGYNRPVWISEAGLAIANLDATSLKKQARYAVTSMVESVANGVDKHFWFILPQFKDGQNLEYGVFNANGTPRPAYASIANATNILGAAEYKGKYNSSGFEGYVFNNGTNDVLVAWSNTATTLTPKQSYKAYDLMGKAISTSSLSIGENPVYVVFDANLDTSLYTKADENRTEMADDLTQNDRIVIQTDFNAKEKLVDVRDTGYHIGTVETRNIDVKVYNFNDSEVTGTLNCVAEGFKVDGNGQKITIPAGESVLSQISITPDTISKGTSGYISVYMTTADGDTSPTVAKVVTVASAKVKTQDTPFDRAYSGPLTRSEKGITFDNTAKITMDLSKPSKNPSGLSVNGGVVTFKSRDQYVEYEVDVKNEGSYYVNFNRANIDSGNFFVAVSVNGETVNRRTGRDDLADGSHVFQDEIWLSEGVNTIRISNMSGNDGTLSNVFLEKLDAVQYTTSMNSHGGGRTFKSAYKSGLAVDPWLTIGDSVASYPKPYVTFTVNIPKTGYYYPAAAIRSSDKICLDIAGTSFDLSGNGTVLEEIFYASGRTNNAPGKWQKSNEIIYLEAGDYDVTLSLYGAANEKWTTSIGAIRFIEHTPSEVNPWVEYDVYVDEAGSYQISAASGGSNQVKFSVNGSLVSYKTGRVQGRAYNDYATWYLYENIVPLQKGKNTVKVELYPKYDQNGAVYYDSNIAEILLIKTNGTPTVSAVMKGITDYKTNVEGLGVDPWAYINTAQSEAPYITFNMEVPDSGTYKVKAAFGGASKPKFSIGEHMVSFESAAKTGEYCMNLPTNGYLSKLAPWYVAGDEIYLEKGIYPIKMELMEGYLSADGNWQIGFAGLQLVQILRDPTLPWLQAQRVGDFIKVSYEADQGTDFEILVSDFANENGIKKLRKISESVSVKGAGEQNILTIPSDGKTEDSYGVYMWNNLSGIKPILDSIQVD